MRSVRKIKTAAHSRYRRHLRGDAGGRQGKSGAELCAGPAHRREGEGKRHCQGRLRPRRLSVSRARESRGRRRAQGRLGVLMADPKDEATPAPEGTTAPTNVPVAEVAAAPPHHRKSTARRAVRAARVVVVAAEAGDAVASAGTATAVRVGARATAWSRTSSRSTAWPRW